MPAKKKAEPKQFVDPNPVMTASREVHPKWERAKVDYTITEGAKGWNVFTTVNESSSWSVGIDFPTEEAALKVAQAIIDYSAGPSKPLADKPQMRKRPMSNTKIKASAIDQLAEDLEAGDGTASEDEDVLSAASHNVTRK